MIILEQGTPKNDKKEIEAFRKMIKMSKEPEKFLGQEATSKRSMGYRKIKKEQGKKLKRSKELKGAMSMDHP